MLFRCRLRVHEYFSDIGFPRWRRAVSLCGIVLFATGAQHAASAVNRTICWLARVFFSVRTLYVDDYFSWQAHDIRRWRVLEMRVSISASDSIPMFWCACDDKSASTLRFCWQAHMFCLRPRTFRSKRTTFCIGGHYNDTFRWLACVVLCVDCVHTNISLTLILLAPYYIFFTSIYDLDIHNTA